ncbi:MAG TPA: TonB-dependent receptor [Rhizomicrobium sp.]
MNKSTYFKSKHLKALLLNSACGFVLMTRAYATNFDIPSGELATALEAYTAQTGIALIVSDNAVKGTRSKGVRGGLSADEALSRILAGTGFTMHRESGAVMIVRDYPRPSHADDASPMHVAASSAPAASGATLETVTVTSSKIGGDVQNIPIAITALSQEQLTSRQIAGGPDLVKEVPNLTFSKTNFSGYNLEIRGIGTQAISVTTDPAVAVAFNDTPFIRNHFFEQEFFDVSQVEVLRGPQGTLYGRNATAGVVNVVSAKPTDQFEAMASVDIGNYLNRRLEGMINLPIVDDKLDLRVAGEWTKRNGYSFNETTDEAIDGRDLWSGRATLGWKPTSDIQAYLIWEHFSEDDDRLRSGKQLCKTDFGPGASGLSDPGKLVAADGTIVTVPAAQGAVFSLNQSYFSQGCSPSSLYSKDAFEVPNGFSLPFINGASFLGIINTNIDPYASTTQSTNLRDIQSAIEPKYLAKNDTLEFNASWNVAPALTLFSDTGYNNDYLWSTEDYNRFDTSPGIFNPGVNTPNGVVCDPQLGCSDRLVVQDLSTERSWQLSQEFRLASSFGGPLNFSAGGNFMHYETDEKYYVFSNTFTLISFDNITLNPRCTSEQTTLYCLTNGEQYYDPHTIFTVPTESPQYVDPNPITKLDNEGHNYFVSDNPYILNSYALFGEAYYTLTDELKLTGGLRWTDDKKHFTEIPSELLTYGYGYPSTGVVDQSWQKFTGRAVVNWSPKLAFTDQSLFYASYAHGYKAGGANPPGAVLISADVSSDANITFPVHPLTFKPEYIDAYELGTKNTLLDGALTLNGDVFYYDYKGYQISEIVDRTSINLNFDATVKGAELEATYEPLPGLKFSFAGGYEATRIANGQSAIDLMDRTAGTPGWVLMKPSVGQASNCIIPEYVAAALVQEFGGNQGEGNQGVAACGYAYTTGWDPVTQGTYVDHPINSSNGYPLSDYGVTNYPGFDPISNDPNAPADVNNGLGLVPNNGEGFNKNVGGHELPGAPHYTVSLTGDYTIPISSNWAATFHSDFYWQAQSWARVFNDVPYDNIRGYSTVNAALVLSSESGWQVMGYVKNIFNATAITGDFLNSDDSGLTTNIFLTDPRLYGIRVTKHFDGGDAPGGGLSIFGNGDGDDKRPLVWLQAGGNFAALSDDQQPFVAVFAPPSPLSIPSDLPNSAAAEKPPTSAFDWEGKLTYQPEDSDWVLKAGIRYGRSDKPSHIHKSLPAQTKTTFQFYGPPHPCNPTGDGICTAFINEFSDVHGDNSEQHMMLDFTLGKDVGLGTFSEHSTSTISAGVRVVRLESNVNSDLNSDPLYAFDKAYFAKYHYLDIVSDQEKRSFGGTGPEVTWDASAPVFGNEGNGEITLDWGVNAAVLFGRQKAQLHSDVQTTYCGYGTLSSCHNIHETPHAVARSRQATVPNLGGYLGLSMRYRDAKVSFGYRADEFFGAMDGGQDTAKSYNRGFAGPYMNISVGLGG